MGGKGREGVRERGRKRGRKGGRGGGRAREEREVQEGEA